MKYIKQFLIILLISFIGEGLNYLIPAPIPASIYGMVILFVCLCTKIIKLDDVKDTGLFLIEIMPLMFIPAGVGLMKSWGVLKSLLIPVLVITVVSLVAVMGISGRVSQSIIKGKKSKAKEESEVISNE
ncbi:MAG: CidA/LrgA family protein [Eubacteriales bacterium]|nr:CidA/LrgA family protein [Eubacteriales bacterium]